MDIYFFSGIHGAGKGTLCDTLKRQLGIQNYSCSSLIKANSTYIENGKAVKNADKNQAALLTGLRKITHQSIVLDGHFCLLGVNNQIITLDFSVFDEINPTKIISVVCNAEEIHHRLTRRDGTSPDVKLLDELQSLELKQAYEYATSRNTPHFVYSSGENTNTLIKWLSL